MDWRGVLWRLAHRYAQPMKQYPVQPIENFPRDPIRVFPCGCEAYEGQFHLTYLKKCRGCKVSSKGG